MSRAAFFAFIPLTTAAAILLAAGCSSSSSPATREDRVCSPGQYGYCLCKNGQDGTKLCHDDGKTFEPCKMGGTELCPGGEQILDDAGNPVPDEDGGGGTGESSDSCPGEALTVDGTKATTVSGDTSLSQSNQGATTGVCSAALNTPERVYELTPAADGALTVKLTPLAGFDAVLYARSGDCSKGAQLDCAGTPGPGLPETLKFNVIGGERIYLFADGKSGSKGAFNLAITLVPGPFCGNGKIDQANEACDDKNKVANDGCSNTCQPEGNPTSAGVCPGMPFVVGNSPVTVFDQSTASYASTYSRLAASCGSSLGTSAPDRVYAITAKKTGTMTVSGSSASFNHQLYARSTCTDQNSQIACANANADNTGETMTFPVVDGSTYYVFVDGVGAPSLSGDVDLTFEIQ